MSSCDWPYLIVPAAVCAALNCRSSLRDFTGAEGPSDASQLLKSRFIPYFSTTVQFSSEPFPLPAPEHMLHFRKLFAGSGERTLGIFAGSTITAPCAFNTAIASDMACC